MSLGGKNLLEHLTTTKANKWDQGLAMPTARHGLVAVANDDKIYVIGGGPNPGGSRSSANEIFLPR